MHAFLAFLRRPLGVQLEEEVKGGGDRHAHVHRIHRVACRRVDLVVVARVRVQLGIRQRRLRELVEVPKFSRGKPARPLLAVHEQRDEGRNGGRHDDGPIVSDDVTSVSTDVVG